MMEKRWVDPKWLFPVHGPGVADKLLAIEEFLRNRGWIGRPILACEGDSGSYDALTGSHRIQAAINVGLSKIPLMVITTAELEATMAKSQRDAHHTCQALVYCPNDTARNEMLVEFGLLEAAGHLRDEMDANDSDAGPPVA